MANIYCSVSNCHYWKTGNYCTANEIMVCSDSQAASAPDNFDATNHSQFQMAPVNTCMESCCKTFVEKGSQQVNADGVYKTP